MFALPEDFGAVRRSMALGLLCAVTTVSAASGDPLPIVDGRKHLGVKSCAASACHGKTSGGNATVRQDEYPTWLRHDAHARAFEVLHSAESKRIARNLGLKRPAHRSDECLDCHSDNVPKAFRGPEFSLEDGVGCEACHGGSADWLGSHYGEATHSENRKAGLYPTDDPKARAELCASCHVGDARRFVDHRIMGAGHPRMSFELDTFSQVQPAHFDVDADYRERGKTAAPAAQVWAVGQAVMARSLFDALLDPKRGRHGAWPEFVLFDCHSCHHPMSDKRYRPNALGPGLVRLNDSSVRMLGHAVTALDTEAGRSLELRMATLVQAMSSGNGAAENEARVLLSFTKKWIDKLGAWKPDAESLRRIAQGVARDGARGAYRDYADAEQATMAIQALSETLLDLGAFDRDQVARLSGAIDQVLKATEDDERFRPDTAERAFEEVLKSFP